LTADTVHRHDVAVFDSADDRDDLAEVAEKKTLGDLLYANQKCAPAPESDWVRLVRSVATGDQLALQEIYEKTNRIVFTLMFRIVHNRETAEELTLDVFHDVWRRAAAYDPANGPVVGWIMNQARSRAIDRLRFEQRKKRVHTEPDEFQAVKPGADPESVLHVEERSRRLKKALEVLTTEERQAIETAFFAESTYQEAAVTLNQPLGTVKSRIRSGLSKLRAAFGRSSESK
jgi:RNA polymerase sigma-70 factor (ECF subfamily)